MPDPNLLLQRINQIGAALSKRKTTLALIGLGSVGQNLDRLDEYSDLDFFVIVQSGTKPEYLQNLDWLTEIAPVTFSFANTKDGYKLLYEDGVFCEFAVFEEQELETAIFTTGRIIWKANGIENGIAEPQQPIQTPRQQSTTWLVGEALSNLYVGLSRDARGEKLSAMRFIQGYAVDRVLELSDQEKPTFTEDQDPFDLERRFETRHPELHQLPTFLQGYERNRESAQAILSYLDQHFEVNPAIKSEILRLCQR
jgi:hypothetical protein